MVIKYRVITNNGAKFIIQARGETLAQKKSWARAFNKNSGVPNSAKIKNIEIIKAKRRVNRSLPRTRILGYRF